MEVSASRVNGMLMHTRVPWPNTLCKVRLPPIDWHRSWLMASPRPVPLRARLLSGLAWAKGRNRRCWSSARIPMPLS
ncbi:hypothetical protein D3C76_1360350 [compost metagenome]